MLEILEDTGKGGTEMSRPKTVTGRHLIAAIAAQPQEIDNVGVPEPAQDGSFSPELFLVLFAGAV